MPRITRRKKLERTIPSIRKGIDAFYAFIRTPRPESEILSKFKALFGKSLSKKNLHDMLKKMPPKAQRGGMAPLGYSMGPPDKALTALPYVQRGFGFANMDSAGLSPKEYLGSTRQMGGTKRLSRQGQKTRQRQRGGGVADFAAAFSAQPFLSSAPMTILQAGARAATGQIGLNSPHPEINPLRIEPAASIHTARLV
jgi:hypothetical protein